MTVDPTTGKVFVADTYNHRVLRYASSTALLNGDPAEGVLGQPNFTSNLANRGGAPAAPAANTLNYPLGLAVDSTGRLWVADTYNHRTLRFDDAASKANGANADGVFGQAGFTTRGEALTQNGMRYPHDVFVDDAGRLWVVDAANHRVLRFDDVHTKANGANADGVLGQPDFTSNAPATTQNGMNQPFGVVVAADGILFVSDGSNHRVLRFNNAAGKADGADADGVLGQSDFTSNAIALTQSGMDSPWGLALDPDGRLFVADRYHNRVLIYEGAANKANGANADGVLGQPDFTTGAANTGTPPGARSAAGLNGPVLAFYDPALPALWVGDSQNHRVLAYGFGITVNTAGSGTGEVSRDPDDQIFGQDSEVTLSADPAYDTYFTGWSQGASPGMPCSGVNDCTLIIDDCKEVTAAFQGPLYVCSPTLDPDTMPKRCHYTSIADALDAAVPGDVIVVSGVVTESVTVDKSVTIQGMLPGDILPDAVRPAPGIYPVYTPGAEPEDIAPGTHMALVQAAPGPDSGGGSVFTIAAGVQVTITQLNIRHGDATPSAGSGQAQGGGINNAGDLVLDSVTLYANPMVTSDAVASVGVAAVILPLLNEGPYPILGD